MLGFLGAALLGFSGVGEGWVLRFGEFNVRGF